MSACIKGGTTTELLDVLKSDLLIYLERVIYFIMKMKQLNSRIIVLILQSIDNTHFMKTDLQQQEQYTLFYTEK